MDRAAVAALVFHDKLARRRLERIIHPRVRQRTAQIVAEAPPDAVVVNDVPLLVEAKQASSYDLVIAVLADAETRVARLVRDRGMAETDVRARMASQATDDERRAVADVVIVNDGSRAALRRAVDAVWQTQIVAGRKAAAVRTTRATRDGR